MDIKELQTIWVSLLTNEAAITKEYKQSLIIMIMCVQLKKYFQEER